MGIKTLNTFHSLHNWCIHFGLSTYSTAYHHEKRPQYKNTNLPNIRMSWVTCLCSPFCISLKGLYLPARVIGLCCRLWHRDLSQRFPEGADHSWRYTWKYSSQMCWLQLGYRQGKVININTYWLNKRRTPFKDIETPNKLLTAIGAITLSSQNTAKPSKTNNIKNPFLFYFRSPRVMIHKYSCSSQPHYFIIPVPM